MSGAGSPASPLRPSARWRCPVPAHSRIRSSSAAGFTSPVTTGVTEASQAKERRRPRPATPRRRCRSRRRAAAPRPTAPGLRRSTVHQRGAAIQEHQVRQRDVDQGLDWLSGSLGQQPGEEPTAASPRPARRGTAGPGTGHRPSRPWRPARPAPARPAPRTPASAPRARRRRRRTWSPASPRGRRSPGPGPGRADHRGPARTSARPARPAPPAPAPAPPPRPRPAARRTRPGTSPAACPSTGRSASPADSETCPAASAASTLGWVPVRLAQAVCPAAAARVMCVWWISQDTALYSASPECPCPAVNPAWMNARAAVRHRVGLLQFPQALSLRRGRELRGVGGGQVAQPGADHVQRLTGTTAGRSTHLGHLLHRDWSPLRAVLVVPGRGRHL